MFDIIKKHSIKNDKKIQQICSPLKYLGIDYFTYYFIKEDGNYGVLSNAFEFMEFYYYQKLYETNPYMSHPNLFRSGHAFTPCAHDDQNKDLLKCRFKADHLFLNLECNSELMEGYIFINSSSSSQTLPNYLNKIDLLKKFSHYFKREASSIIGKMDAEKYNMHSVRKKNFLTIPNDLPLINKNDQEQRFLSEIWGLSPQEQRCLDMFKKGNSAQSTAAKLGLSQRTVEHYMDNVKIKLGCESKWDLLNT